MWLHAFACLSGQSLAAVAAACGVELYAGYRTTINVSWVEPPPAEPEFTALVTALTQALVLGERDPARLQAQVSGAADAFIEALMASPNLDDRPDLMSLHILAHNLSESLVVVRSADHVTPPP